MGRGLVHPVDVMANKPWSEDLLDYLAGYLQRLSGPELHKVREDLECLAAFARQEKWPKQKIQFLKSFLADFGVGEQGEAK